MRTAAAIVAHYEVLRKRITAIGLGADRETLATIGAHNRLEHPLALGLERAARGAGSV